MKRFALILLLLLPAGFSFAQSELESRLREQIVYLTSPELAGRDTPGPNGDSVAVWVEMRFREAGIAPLPVNPFDFERTEPAYRSAFKILTSPLHRDYTALWLYDRLENFAQTDMKLPDPEEMRLRDVDEHLIGVSEHFRLGESLYYFPDRINYFDQCDLEGYDCGYGIELPSTGRNDYPAAVGGKVAFALAGSDLPADQVGMRSGAAFKAASAERADALALVICYPDSSLWPPVELLPKIADADEPIMDVPFHDREFPVLYLRLPAGKSVASLIKRKKIRVKAGYHDPVYASASNVIAAIPGMTNRWIVVGAHYDHVGEGFPGADDNASGLVGLLELARRWGKLKEAPQRGIIFAAFGSEEDGQLGSRAFMGTRPMQLEEISAMINLDMIGRQGSATMRGTPTENFAAAYFSAQSPDLQSILKGAADGVDLNVEVKPVNSFRRFGDCASFHERQIPTIHIYSGFHADYHKPGDTADKIDYAKLTKMIDLADRAIRNLVEAPTGPRFDPSIKAPAGAAPY